MIIKKWRKSEANDTTYYIDLVECEGGVKIVYKAESGQVLDRLLKITNEGNIRVYCAQPKEFITPFEVGQNGKYKIRTFQE